jgi:hypothetical protein
MCFATGLIPGAYAELQDNRDHFAALVVKGLGSSPVFEVWKDNSEKMALRPDKTLEHLQTNISMYRNICLFDIFCDFVFAKKYLKKNTINPKVWNVIFSLGVYPMLRHTQVKTHWVYLGLSSQLSAVAMNHLEDHPT